MTNPTIDWVTTFARFRPGRMPLIGPIIVRVADWSKPQAGRAPMFDNEVLERLSVAHPAFPLAVYGPIGLFLLWRGWGMGYSAPALAGLYLVGLFIWSWLEYVAHRGSFHHVPSTEGQVAYGYLVHGVHHAYPDDSRRWVMPLIVSIPLAGLLFLLFRLVFGPVGEPMFGGFVHGYLTYDLLHYFIHRGKMRGRLGRYLRQYHLTHHYASPDRHFGVSSPLWDVVFRTR
jgi:sterol desaturase/sphingolipid hydroxylase (fatty acid hydroxylase superfamily)